MAQRTRRRATSTQISGPWGDGRRQTGPDGSQTWIYYTA